jgi:hypothetical protein
VLVVPSWFNSPPYFLGEPWRPWRLPFLCRPAQPVSPAQPVAWLAIRIAFLPKQINCDVKTRRFSKLGRLGCRSQLYQLARRRAAQGHRDLHNPVQRS